MLFKNLKIGGEKAKIGIMLLILISCSIITFYFQFILHIGTVFTHFFYIPIFLAAVWWKRKGLIVPIFLAILLIVSHMLVGPLNFPITDDYLRAFMFLFVGLVVTFLTERITESREMLRESEEKFTSVVQSAFEAIITVDKKGKIISWNHGAENIFGYNKQSVINKPLTILMPERFIKQYQKSWNGNSTGDFIGRSVEMIGLKSDGKEFTFEMSIAQWDYKDQDYYTAIVHDISDRKIAENELQNAKNRLEVIFQEAPDAYYLNDMDGNIIDGNKASEILTGYKKEELIGKNLFDVGLLPKSELNKALNNIHENALGHSTGPDEFDIKTKRGEIVPVEIMAVPVNFDGQELVLGLARDITQRKKAEKALNIVEKRLGAVAESAIDGIVTTDTNGKIVFFNKSLETIFGYSRQELVNQPITILMPERNRNDFTRKVEKFKTTGEHILAGRVMETVGLRKEGNEFPFEMSLATWNSGNEIFSTSIIRDITERKKAEKQLKRSLKEKEMLLKEIHHRVKNNLMVISSLLNLQSKYIKDKESLDIFKESQNRAQSMALIHERLYRSTDLKRIDFGDYIKTLALQLYHTYMTDLSQVDLKFYVEPVMLDINTTIPLGLIVNELISNSMKHAFPEGRKGEINIILRKLEKSGYELSVKDNGKGFPEKIDYKNTESLGLQLVNSLTEQIDGEIELDTTSGTNFLIRFKEKKYNS